ncbi:MAG: helix-turn-helix domain-containing protein [Sedimentisphaerales bacterium]|nr:helix-turn-helix domain-containing protein [Sedimentisphaerales bacterium]
MTEPKKPIEISQEISNKIKSQLHLQQYRKKCLEFAQSMREYDELGQLRHFEGSLYCDAIDRFPHLQLINKPPDPSIINTFNEFVMNYPKRYIDKYMPIGTPWYEEYHEYPDYPYHLSKQRVSHLIKEIIDNLDWEWQEIYIKDASDNIVTVKQGWAPKSKAVNIKREDIPWPYHFLGGNSREERGFLLRRDGYHLPAMYVLTALCHDHYEEDTEYRIITAEMAEVYPNIYDLCPTFDLADRCSELDKMAGFLSGENIEGLIKDLNRAWEEVQADLAKLQDDTSDINSEIVKSQGITQFYNTDDMLTVGEIARLCNKSSSRITQLCNMNKIKCTAKGRNRRVSRLSALTYFAEQDKQKNYKRALKVGYDEIRDTANIARDERKTNRRRE